MQPRCVQVVEIAASLSPSRTMQTRCVSRETRAPEGNSSGLPIENRLGCPYVARGFMKIKLESAVIIRDPNRPNPLNHASTRRRVTASPFSSTAVLTGTFIFLLLPWRRGCFLHVRPEHLVFRLFQIAEVVLLHRKNKHQDRSNAHAQAGDNRDPREFHRPIQRIPVRPIPSCLALRPHARNPYRLALLPRSRGNRSFRLSRQLRQQRVSENP